MLWLNPSTGDVAEAPNRPSAAWVIIVESIIDGQPIESTLEGLRRILLSNDTSIGNLINEFSTKNNSETKIS